MLGKVHKTQTFRKKTTLNWSFGQHVSHTNPYNIMLKTHTGIKSLPKMVFLSNLGSKMILSALSVSGITISTYFGGMSHTVYFILMAKKALIMTVLLKTLQILLKALAKPCL